MPQNSAIYTPTEAAAILGTNVRTLATLRRRGLIGFRQTGTGSIRPRVIYTQADLDAYMARTHRGAIALRGRY